jgi:L-threonylcarbamoyladenylate synthase
MNDYEQDIKNCIEYMTHDGVILYPTDTIWGLGCDATNENAIEKIVELKNREVSKSFILLMTDVKQLSRYIADPLPNLQDLIDQLPMPTTIIYSNAINLPYRLINEDQSIAVRITKDPFCRSLIKRLRQPIVSTSANISGQPSPTTFYNISDEIKQKVDYIVQWRLQDTEPKEASSILKLNKHGHFDKIR